MPNLKYRMNFELIIPSRSVRHIKYFPEIQMNTRLTSVQPLAYTSLSINQLAAAVVLVPVAK